MPPMALTESIAPEGSPAPFDTVSDPSNRGPKIAAVVALLIAAGLSGVGLAMRGTPPTPGAVAATQDAPKTTEPQSPRRAHAVAEPRGADLNRPARTPTAVTDLPLATDSVERPASTSTGGVAAAAKAAEAIVAKLAASATSESLAAAPAAPRAVAEVAAANEASANARGRETAEALHAAVPSEGTTESAAAAPTPAPLTGSAITPGAANPAPPLAGNGAPAVAPAGAVAVGAAPPAATPPAAAPLVARGKGDFNTQAAREALEDAAARAARCKTIDTPSGTARIAVTFAPSGQATNAIIESGPFVGTAAGTCVASKFKGARVPPFSGDSVQVHKTVPF